MKTAKLIPFLNIFVLLSLFLIFFAARCWLLFDKSLAIYFLAPLAALLLGLGLALLIYQQRLWSFSSSLNKDFFIYQSLFWAFYLGLIYPGYYNYDSFRTLEMTLAPEAGAWQTHMYGFLCSTLALFDKNLFLLPVFSTLLSFFIYRIILEIFPLRHKKHLHWIFIGSLWPLHLMTFPFLMRDVPFGLMTCILLFSLLPYYLKKEKTMTGVHFLALFFIFYLSNEIRQDGVVQYLLLPFAFYFSGNESLRHFLKPVTALCLFFFATNLFLQKFNHEGYRQRYEITALFHPINAIYHSPERNTSIEDDAIVHQIMDLKYWETEYNPIGINQLHEGKHKLPVPPEVWREFRWTYLKLILKNSSIFLAERSYILATTFGFYRWCFIFADETNSPPAHFQNQFGNDYFKKDGTLKDIHRLITEAMTFLRASLHYFTVTRVLFLGPLGLLLVAFYLLRRHPELSKFFSVCMIFILARSIFVFLLSPEPHLTYYSPLVYFPFYFIVTALLKEWSLRTPEEKRA